MNNLLDRIHNELGILMYTIPGFLLIVAAYAFFDWRKRVRARKDVEWSYCGLPITDQSTTPMPPTKPSRIDKPAAIPIEEVDNTWRLHLLKEAAAKPIESHPEDPGAEKWVIPIDPDPMDREELELAAKLGIDVRAEKKPKQETKEEKK